MGSGVTIKKFATKEEVKQWHMMLDFSKFEARMFALATMFQQLDGAAAEATRELRAFFKVWWRKAKGRTRYQRRYARIGLHLANKRRKR